MTETRVRITGSGVDLEGVLHAPAEPAPSAGVVVCHPHPRYGGDMHNSVVQAAIRGVLAHGIAALCFNFRGVGRSTGTFDGGSGEADDARAALAVLSGTAGIDPRRTGLAGYSFGAEVAARSLSI